MSFCKVGLLKPLGSQSMLWNVLSPVFIPAPSHVRSPCRLFLALSWTWKLMLLLTESKTFPPFFSILEKLLYFFWVLLFSALLILLRTCRSGWNLIEFWNSISRKRLQLLSASHITFLPSFSFVRRFLDLPVDQVGLRFAVVILMDHCMSAGVMTAGWGSLWDTRKAGDICSTPAV